MATYVIGDIQGCFDSLQGLLGQLDLQDSDRIWLCGDLVNRGPKSAEVLRWAMAQGEKLVTVLGNHDLHALSAAAGARKPKKRDTFGDILQAQDSEELLRWLRRQPLMHREQGHVLVHAGLHPCWTIDDAEAIARECESALASDTWLSAWQASRPTPPPWSDDLVGEERLASALSILVGVRTVYDDGRLEVGFAGPPADRPSETQPWYEGRSAEEETIVFGHWAALGLYIKGNRIGLDTGCVWGHALTAIRLEDRAVFQQAAID